MKVRRSLARTGTGRSLGTELGKRLSIVSATHLGVEGPAALADPADSPRGDTGNERMGEHVLRHDRTCSNHGSSTDSDATEDGGICADRSAILHYRRSDVPVRRIGSGIEIVCETNMRADENSIADGHSLVDRCEVLDLASIPEYHIGIDIGVFADSAKSP